MATPMEPFLTMRDAVMEIRDDVKGLAAHIDRIDREGSIGTKQDLDDHENRIRVLEGGSSRLAGAWATAGIAASVLAGLAGLAVGVAAFVLN